MPVKLKLLFTRTLRRQLIIGMVLVVAIMMSLLVYDLTLRQQAAMLEQQSEIAVALAQSIASSSSVWVESHDLGGLQEIINGLQHYPDLQYAIVLNTQGQVLAHTDVTKRGLYLNDLPKNPQLKFLGLDTTIADVANPIMLGGTHIGWVRIGMGQHTMAAKLNAITRNGIYYAFAAIALSALLALLAARRLTRRLYTIQSVADAVQGGQRNIRANVSGVDEAAQLAAQFNNMLDELSAREEEILASHDALAQSESHLLKLNQELEQRVEMRTADIKAARDEAERANKAKSIFLANMSHELRTPLNAILGFSDLLRHDANITTEQKDNLKIIHKSGDHLLNLINDVLDIAKIEAGRIVLQPAPFDLSAMILDISDMLHVRATEKNLQLLLDQSSQFPRYIIGDEAKLRQVLINLISNAIKETEKGGITMRLGLKPENPARLLMEVEDTGHGIAAEDQARLMQPFVQVGIQNKQQGTGLGLAISRQFIELMGGELTFISEPGKGSTFRVDIPLHRVDAAEIPALPKVRGGVIALAPGQTQTRVLVAEDQRENQLLLMRILESAGFTVRLAKNGAEAIEQFSIWQPHFIWMDIRMPVLDGIAATRQIRTLPGGDQVKIVAVTASIFREQKTEILAAGMNDILHKPYRTEQIFDCMEQHLGVRFVRETLALAQPPVAMVTGDMMAVLPETLRTELREAALALDPPRILSAIDAIGRVSAELAPALGRLAKRYDYAAILALLEV